MEGIDQATETTEQFDLSELEDMVIPEQGATSPPGELKTTDQPEELVLTETAKRKARSVVKWIERAFRFKVSSFRFEA